MLFAPPPGSMLLVLGATWASGSIACHPTQTGTYQFAIVARALKRYAVVASSAPAECTRLFGVRPAITSVALCVALSACAHRPFYVAAESYKFARLFPLTQSGEACALHMRLRVAATVGILLASFVVPRFASRCRCT